MSVVAIVQARYGSTRLPGKVLESIGNHTVLQHVCARVQMAVPKVVVATPNSPKDARVYTHAKNDCRVKAFMWDGPETDVLGRYLACAVEHDADVIVRVTSDCPFVDPAMIASLVEVQARTGTDYVGCTVQDSPQVDGLDCEVFTRVTLATAEVLVTNPYDREHVTPWLRRALRNIITLRRSLFFYPDSPHRWTLDTAEDLAWMQSLAEHVDCTPPNPTVADLCRLLSARPELARYADAMVAA